MLWLLQCYLRNTGKTKRLEQSDHQSNNLEFPVSRRQTFAYVPDNKKIIFFYIFLFLWNPFLILNSLNDFKSHIFPRRWKWWLTTASISLLCANYHDSHGKGSVGVFSCLFMVLNSLLTFYIVCQKSSIAQSTLFIWRICVWGE